MSGTRTAVGRVATRAILAVAALAALLLASPAPAELLQEGSVRLAVSGSLSPKRLPRHGSAPIEVKIGGHISSTAKGRAPQLESLSFAFNKAGEMNPNALPKCRLGRIDPSTSQEALAACHDSLVGEGRFSANVRFPEQSPFPSKGKVLAFNGVLRGSPTIFAHIYGTDPVPTSYVLPLEIHKARGTFATRLDASLPQATGKWGYVTGLSLKLGATYSSHGKTKSFLSAGCPAPAGFPGALFPLVKTSFSFVGQKTLTTILNRSCEAKG